MPHDTGIASGPPFQTSEDVFGSGDSGLDSRHIGQLRDDIWVPLSRVHAIAKVSAILKHPHDIWIGVQWCVPRTREPVEWRSVGVEAIGAYERSVWSDGDQHVRSGRY